MMHNVHTKIGGERVGLFALSCTLVHFRTERRNLLHYAHGAAAAAAAAAGPDVIGSSIIS